MAKDHGNPILAVFLCGPAVVLPGSEERHAISSAPVTGQAMA